MWMCWFSIYIQSESSNIPNRIYHIKLDVRLYGPVHDSAHTKYLPLYKSSIWKTVLSFFVAFFLLCFLFLRCLLDEATDERRRRRQRRQESREKKDYIRGIKYKRLSASQSSHLCTLFTVLHKYIERYAIIRTLETQLRYAHRAERIHREHTARHQQTQERQNERTETISQHHIHTDTQFSQKFLFNKFFFRCPCQNCTILIWYRWYANYKYHRTQAFGRDYRAISVNQMLIDRFTLVAKWVFFFFFDWHTNGERRFFIQSSLTHSLIRSLTLSLTQFYTLRQLHDELRQAQPRKIV